LEVICAGDDEKCEFFIKSVAKLVKYPWLKLGVSIVMLSRQGAGKNTILDVILEIFGRHGIEITQQAHATGKFNQHLRHKIFVVLNEATWGGDKQSEGAFKAAITECKNLFESKGVDVQQGENFWSFFISTNEKWAIPATTDGRRFSMYEVSNHRIGDHAYFAELHNAIEDHEKYEFLWYLLHKVDVELTWRAEAHMPVDSGTAFADQILQDRKNASLKWLVDQLHEFDEWRDTITDRPIIQSGRETYVLPRVVFGAWKLQVQDRNAQFQHQRVLTDFLKTTLGGDCFSNRGPCPAAKRTGPPEDYAKNMYRFASAERIRTHIATHVLRCPNYFAPVLEREPKRARQQQEEEEN
jgi:hypothetical protein